MKSGRQVGWVEQAEAFACGCERLRGVARVDANSDGSEVTQIGPNDNNLRVTVECQIREDTSVNLRTWSNGYSVSLESLPGTGFRITMRGGTEAALLLAALRQVLNKVSIVPEYGEAEK